MQIDTITQPRKGDLVLIQDWLLGTNVHAFRVDEVKETSDGTEITLRKRGNIWFDWGLYMAGVSWVKDCRVVLP